MEKKLLLLLLLFCSLNIYSQPAQRLIKVNIAPDSENWLYKTGEKAKFKVNITQNGIPVKDAEVRYELSYDMLEPFKTEKKILKDGQLSVDGGTMKEPGFLRLRVFATYNGRIYENKATVGFSPEKIVPTTKLPADFVEYWEKAKEQNAKIPMDPKLILIPEKCNEKINVYEISLQNYRNGSRVYGILCVPKAPGKYPALLRVPGAGIRPYGGDTFNAERGYITLEIGIHGIPVRMDSKVYDDLRASGLYDYQHSNLDNRDQYYYKRVYMGCVRAVDYIFSMNEFDGENVYVAGGSQGGALTVITAGLDNRIKGGMAFYPAMADMNGYLHNCAGGWPHMFKNVTKRDAVIDRKEENLQYYDVVNFARQVKVPIFYSFGYNDMVCAPTTTQAAFNVIPGEKTLHVVPEIEHWTYPEMWQEAWNWLDRKVGKK